jgi:signal transduction histidine kinase
LQEDKSGPAQPLDIDEVQDLFENAPCGYVSAQANGRILRANQTLSGWLGCEPDALVRRRFQDLLNIAGKIYFETHFAPLLKMQGFFNEVALDLVGAGGAVVPVLVNAVEREAPGGRFIRMTIFNASDRRRYERELLDARRATDQANADLRALNETLEARIVEAVQERLQVEERLRQSQKMEAVGQLTGGIAHDFNNMLAIVIGALSLAQRRLARGETAIGEYIATAMEGANRAAALTHRLLAFSRQQPLSPRALNANQMVSEMSELLRRTLGETIQMETVLAGGLWQVRADSSQLENAILNLAVNARDAMPEGGRLTIETANAHLDDSYAADHNVSAGQYVMLAVTDTGGGMSHDVVARAFDPFFTTKGAGKGTGLGLSQVFGFVKQSGGHVKIYSEPAQGTTVKIYLPRFYGAAEAPRRASPQPLRPGSPSELVLLVEDDERVRAISAQMLRDLGYGVIAAAAPDEALRLLSDEPGICLLFTDVVMPTMSGKQLADAAMALKPGLKVLFTTGYTSNAVVHNGVLDPGVFLLPKPVTLEQLAAKLRTVLDG